MSTPTDEQPHSRRKACDLCFTKKIKCDMLEPECSNCVLYRTQCRASIVRSRTKLPRPRPVTQKKGQAEKCSKAMNDRMETIEEKLREIIETTKKTHTAPVLKKGTSPDSRNSNENCSGRSLLWKFDPVEPSLYYGHLDGDLDLPHLDKIMPVIDHYFGTFNRTLPLFNQSKFMRLVSGWHGRNSKPDRATWAAILVVIAMGLQSQVPGTTSSPGSAENLEWAEDCMRRAQSVIPELVTRDEDLLGIQVLLSLVLLFRNSSDLRPASTLLGAAVRLSHRMQLHSSDSARYYTAEDTEDRLRIFWILYILDKHISLWTKTPPMLSDDDIDAPLPPIMSSGGIGIIYSKDQKSEIDIFRTRIDLAFLECKVYRMLYASRSIKIPSSERQQRISHLEMLLDNWYSRIPLAFRMETVSTEVSDEDLSHITALYHAYLGCIITTHGVFSSKTKWMQRVSSLSRAAVQDFAVAVQGPRVTLCTQNPNPPLASGWNQCVNVSRGTMMLFQVTTPTPYLLWQCSCPHFSALVIILANILTSPPHSSARMDLEIATKSIQLFGQLVDVIQSAKYAPLERVIKDLHRSAVSAVATNELEHISESDALDSLGDAERETNLFVDESSSPGFEYDDIQVGGNSEFERVLDSLVAEGALSDGWDL